MEPRQKFFLSTVLSVFLGVALAGFILLISKKHSVPLDLTENRRYTLADQSIQAVEQLKEPVKVYGFIDEANKRSRPDATDLLDRYVKINPSKFSFELVDPERSPMLASKFQVKIPGPAIVEVQQSDKTKPARNERVNAITEDDITNALLKINRSREMKLYTLAGHGERTVDPGDKSGLGSFKADLAKEGFQVEELNLGKTPKLPDDCKVILVAGPTTELRDAEAKIISDFVAKQGRLMMLIDPESPMGWVTLARQWGVDLPEEIIIDPNAQRIQAQPIFALALVMDPEHPVTKALRVNLEFRVARPVFKMKDGVPEGAKLDQLAATGPEAFVIPAADFLNQTRLELPARPKMHSIPLAMAVSIPKDPNAPPPTDAAQAAETKPESRVVVVGDSDFVGNLLFKRSGNRDFALNTVNWLAETENQISIRPRDPKSEPLRLSQGDMTWMLFWHVLAIPFAVAGMGFISVMLRKR